MYLFLSLTKGHLPNVGRFLPNRVALLTVFEKDCCTHGTTCTGTCCGGVVRVVAGVTGYAHQAVMQERHDRLPLP